MRIIGTKKFGQIQVTAFKTDTRISIQFVAGPFEQWYKFVQTDLMKSWGDVEKILDDNTIRHCFSVFDLMNNWYTEKSAQVKDS